MENEIIHTLSIEEPPLGGAFPMYSGGCSCGNWECGGQESPNEVRRLHDNHVAEVGQVEKKWEMSTHTWSGAWTVPEPSDGPEIVSITGEISPHVAQMEVVYDDGRRVIWKRV